MKKTLYAIAALALLFTGCAKEYNETFAPGDVVTLRAKVNDTYTKVAADNAGTFSWQAEDKITVLNSAGNAFEFTTSTGDSPFTCTAFDGSLGETAYYPASASHTSSSFFLEPELAWKNGETNMPMIGAVNTGTKSVEFTTAGAAIKLVCYNVAADARKLVVSSDSKNLSGAMTISAGAITTGNGSNTITITFDAGHPSTMVFFIPVPTGALGTLSFVMKDGSDAAVSNVQATKGEITMTRRHIVAAPAMNCGIGDIIWSEDFSQYSANDVPDGKQYMGGSDISYSCTSGEGGTTKIYEEATAGGTSPELLVSKKSGTFKVSNIPCSGVSDMTLTFTKNNNALSVTATEGITVSGATSGAGEKTITLKNTNSLDVFDLTFTGPSGTSNTRVDDFVLISIVAISGAPSITSANSLTIPIASGGTNTANTTFTYTNPLDANPVVATVLEDVDWLTPSIEGSTLTVSAPKNTTGAQRSATVRLRATGVYKDITINQPNALVGNPSVDVSNEDQAFTAYWSGVSNATSYLAYFGETDNLEANPTSLTALTPSYDEGTSKWSVTKSGLTNGNTYYLYVKTNEVTSNYVAPVSYVKYVVEPVGGDAYKVFSGTFAKISNATSTLTLTEPGSTTVTATISISGSDVALGQNVDGTKGAQVGTAKKPCEGIEITAPFTGSVSSISINTSGASSVNATLEVSVGGTTYKCGANDSVSLTSTATEYTFTGTGSGAVTITITNSSAKAIYLKTLSITGIK